MGLSLRSAGSKLKLLGRAPCGGAIIALVLAASARAQEGVQAPARAPGVELRLGGEVSVYYLYRDQGLVEFESGLNAGTAPSAPAGPQSFVSGVVGLKLDASYEKISATLEIRTKSIDRGQFLGFGPGTSDDIRIALRSAFVRAKDFPLEDVSIYLGVRNLKAEYRHWGEPFFLDVASSESAFVRMNDAGTQIRNYVFRDQVEPVGVLLRYDPTGPLRVDAFAYRLFDNEGLDRVTDEDVYGVHADVMIHPERAKAFFLFTAFQGDGDPTRPAAFNAALGRSSFVYTVGAGADVFLLDGRELELFGEGYYQFGQLTTLVAKSAWAYKVGGRLTLTAEKHSWFVEFSYRELSGDGDPTDRTDHAFQSYENESALAILQSNLFGLDADKNLQAFTASAGVLGLEIPGAGKLDARIDLAAARFAYAPRNDAGLAFVPPELGYEVDLGARWRYAAPWELFVTFAALVDSRVLAAFAPDGTRWTWLFVAGSRFTF